MLLLFLRLFFFFSLNLCACFLWSLPIQLSIKLFLKMPKHSMKRCFYMFSLPGLFSNPTSVLLLYVRLASVISTVCRFLSALFILSKQRPSVSITASLTTGQISGGTFVLGKLFVWKCCCCSSSSVLRSGNSSHGHTVRYHQNQNRRQNM